MLRCTIIWHGLRDIARLLRTIPVPFALSLSKGRSFFIKEISLPAKAGAAGILMRRCARPSADPAFAGAT
ncbi:hypothetical protein [uncultured Sphingopyxis sp.]|uniref:hypothetical protein n=1 Tax=uncultured Sphingopyxis sp. TaxID=310581 RepID=UPI0025CD843B|nr:hypothetical protein [uncultured Sphingopyxis sp.]